jgi:hypothetical protein
MEWWLLFEGRQALKVIDGMIVEELGLDDGVTVLTQLGLVPVTCILRPVVAGGHFYPAGWGHLYTAATRELRIINLMLKRGYTRMTHAIGRFLLWGLFFDVTGLIRGRARDVAVPGDRLEVAKNTKFHTWDGVWRNAQG